MHYDNLILTFFSFVNSENMAYRSPPNQNNFDENFEDSEANYSRQSDYPLNETYNNTDGHPVQLIRILHNGKIQLCQQGADIICNSQLPIGFVVVAGKYRTGKSFLLNKLLRLQGKGFRVDSSSNACTEGIWMWSHPDYNQKYGSNTFYLDTEGIYSLTKNPEHDVKIFTLACLISSYFIYNSFGTITQNNIEDINLVTNLAKRIQMKENASIQENQDLIKHSGYMPKFLWLLRDFTLKLQDQRGRRLSARDYLHNALNQQNTTIKSNETVRKVKRSLKTYFKDLDCMTMVRPAVQESQLQRLESNQDQFLRKQFMDAVLELQQKIIENTSPKQYEGNPLYGTAIISMIEDFIEAFNTGQVPNIKTAWEHIEQNEGNVAYSRAISKYTQLLNNQFTNEQPKDDDELNKILRDTRQQVLLNFTSQMKDSSESNLSAYLQKLKAYCTEMQKQIIDINRQKNQNNNRQIMKDCSTKLMKMILDNQLEGRQIEINDQLSRVKDQYYSRAKGKGKQIEVTKLLQAITPVILTMASKKSKAGAKSQYADQTKQINDKQLNSLKEQIKNMKNQLTRKQEQINQIKKKELPKKPGKDDKKGSKGCCGTSSCLIM